MPTPTELGNSKSTVPMFSTSLNQSVLKHELSATTRQCENASTSGTASILGTRTLTKLFTTTLQPEEEEEESARAKLLDRATADREDHATLGVEAAATKQRNERGFAESSMGGKDVPTHLVDTFIVANDAMPNTRVGSV